MDLNRELKALKLWRQKGREYEVRLREIRRLSRRLRAEGHYTRALGLLYDAGSQARLETLIEETEDALIAHFIAQGTSPEIDRRLERLLSERGRRKWQMAQKKRNAASRKK